MKNTYSVHELLEDASFHQFVADPTSEDGRRWQKWLEAYPEQSPVIEEARQLLLSLNLRRQTLDQQTIDDAWQNVYDQTHQKEASYPGNILLRVAAAVALLLMAGTYYWLQMQQDVVYQTGYGEIKEVLLEDGTKVKLNANSSIRYHPDRILKSSREVALQGEAFFDVSHHQHEGQPSRFLVRTENGVVEVLGTRFNVQSRHHSTQVVLESGSVSFETHEKQKATLSPGEMLEYSEQNPYLRLQKVNPRKFTAWRDQKLFFDDTSLADLAKILQDTYGKKVVISNETLRSKKLSGEISAEDMDKVLLAVSRLFSIQITQHKDTIFFESNAQ